MNTYSRQQWKLYHVTLSERKMANSLHICKKLNMYIYTYINIYIEKRRNIAISLIDYFPAFFLHLYSNHLLFPKYPISLKFIWNAFTFFGISSHHEILFILQGQFTCCLFRQYYTNFSTILSWHYHMAIIILYHAFCICLLLDRLFLNTQIMFPCLYKKLFYVKHINFGLSSPRIKSSVSYFNYCWLNFKCSKNTLV